MLFKKGDWVRIIKLCEIIGEPPEKLSNMIGGTYQIEDYLWTSKSGLEVYIINHSTFFSSEIAPVETLENILPF